MRAKAGAAIERLKFDGDGGGEVIGVEDLRAALADIFGERPAKPGTKPCTCHSGSGPGRRCAYPDGRGLGELWHCEETGAVGLGASQAHLASLEAQLEALRDDGAAARRTREVLADRWANRDEPGRVEGTDR